MEREADDVLYRKLSQGDFCYVLTPRQMGKTSLRVRVRQRLEQDGLRCVSLDLSAIGQRGATQDQWYEGILAHLEARLSLPEQAGLTRSSGNLTRIDQLQLFFSERVFPNIKGRIVIFIDEIDSVLKYSFDTDDLFEFIRFTKNEGAELEGFDRLTFALLGTATPSDLIKSRRTTPFNIGTSINLTGFTFEQARPLLPGLALNCSDPEQTLRTILDYTSGQPFLTQKLCRLVTESQTSGPAANRIASLVEHEIVQDWETQDHPQHLRTVRDTLVADDTETPAVVGLYRDVLERDGVPPPEGHAKMQLVLSGVARVENGKLRSANRVYADVFNIAWVDETLRNVRPYGATFERWLQSGGEDASALLQGDELAHARTWATGRALSIDDYEYLWAAEAAERKALIVANDRKLKELEQQVDTKERKLEVTRRQSMRIAVMGLLSGALGVGGLLWNLRKVNDLQQKGEHAAELLKQREQQISTKVIERELALESARAADREREAAKASAAAAAARTKAAAAAEAAAKAKLDETQKLSEKLAGQVQSSQQSLRAAQQAAAAAQQAHAKAKAELALAQQEKERAEAEALRQKEQTVITQNRLEELTREIGDLKERLRNVEARKL